MSGKILVAYATRYGSTGEIAEEIGNELRKEGSDVDVLPAGEVRDPAQYQGVVIGSPIYMGKWLAEAQVFVEKNQAMLRQIPVALFTVGLSAREESKRKAEEPLVQIRILVQPIDVGIFAGRLDPKRLSLSDRAIVTMIRAPAGDFIDRGAVRSWASRIRPKLDAA